MNKMRDLSVMILVLGLIGLLALIVVGEFIAAIGAEANVDPAVIGLLEMSITGTIGVIGGYISGRGQP
jgi:hypothetical protein